MSRKKRIRHGLDVLMLVFLMLLMTYERIGQATHEYIGISMLIGVGIHQALNRKWYQGLRRGRFRAARLLRTAVNAVLLADLVMQFASGILLSRHALAFLPIHGGRFQARSFHVLGAYWGMALMAVHLGMHGSMMGRALGRRIGKRAQNALRAGCILAAAYGAYALVKRQVIDYMFLRIPFVYFDFEELLIFFMLDYAAIILLFAAAGYGAMRLAEHADARQHGGQAV